MASGLKLTLETNDALASSELLLGELSLVLFSELDAKSGSVEAVLLSL